VAAVTTGQPPGRGQGLPTSTPQELRLKGSPAGQELYRPAGPTPGEQDREIVSFDGRVLITASSTRMPRSVTATWSMYAARRGREAATLDAVHSGAMRSIEPGNLEIPGLVLTHHPGMTSKTKNAGI